MAEVIYVRGGKTTDPAPEEQVWQNAHPRGKRSNTKLTLFDYAEGKRKYWRNWNGDQPPSVAPDGTAGVSSVIDLYEYIKSLGDSSPGTLTELHFFTHADEKGPILIDTYDNSADPNARDANDKDPRIKDFSIGTVLGGPQATRFKKAFAPSSLVKLWGCTHLEQYRQMIRRDYYQSKKSSARKAAKENYQRFIRDATYQYALHRAIGIPVYAAPLGWGTNPHLPFGIQGQEAIDKVPNARFRGKWPPSKGDRWWRVSPFFRPDKGYAFFQKVLGAKMDILDYVGYTEEVITASYIDLSDEGEIQLAEYPAEYSSEYPG
jgi:hypothetical protein